MIPNFLSHRSLYVCLRHYKGSDGHCPMTCWLSVSGEELLCHSPPIPCSVHTLWGTLRFGHPRICAIYLLCCCSFKTNLLTFLVLLNIWLQVPVRVTPVMGSWAHWWYQWLLFSGDFDYNDSNWHCCGKIQCVAYALWCCLGDIYSLTLVVFWHAPNVPALIYLKIPSSSGSRVIMYNGISSWRCEQGEILIKYYVYLCFLWNLGVYSWVSH